MILRFYIYYRAYEKYIVKLSSPLKWKYFTLQMRYFN